MAKKKNKKPSFANWLSREGFLLLAMVPVIQWLPCLVMNGKARKKRWLFMGIAYMVIGLGAFVGMVAVEDWSMNSYVSYPKGPSEDDYRDFTYNDFENSDGTINWDNYYAAVDEWEKTDEYDVYKADLDAYFESDEYVAASNANTRRYRIRELSVAICFMILALKYFVYMVWIYFIERYRFKDAMREIDSKQQAYRNIAKQQPQSKKNIQDNWKSITENAPSTAENLSFANTRTESNVVPDTINGIINVNNATEAQFSSLPLINVVDAKRIIAYRTENGSFKTKDEFFNCFNAKPHVIVKLQDSITVDNAVKKAVKAQTTPSKPRFDL